MFGDMQKSTGIAGILLLSLLVAGVPAAAQTVRGVVQGQVLDVTGAVIGGAQVQVRSETNGFRASTRSDDAGWFVVNGVEPGTYLIDVALDGFRRHVQPFTLHVNQRLRLDVALQVGPITQTVNVEAPRSTIEIRPGSLTTRFLPETITNLPLDGRNFLDLTLLAPGSAPAAQGSAGSVRGEFAVHLNGAREDANSFLLDGVYNFDPKLNGVAVRPPIEAIREFEVVGSLPDASFGRSAGAQINVITRSGSNQLSFTAYEFLRTKAFNARNYFAPENEPSPDYLRHQYGVAAGGPIARGRVFFFGDYDGTWLREGLTRVTNVPTLAERDGDFSNSLFPIPRNPLTGEPFPNGRIPPEFQHPTGRAIAKLYPEPNRSAPFANFVSSPDQRDDGHQFDARVDVVSPSYTITSRYSFSDRTLFEPFAGTGFPQVPGYGNDVARQAHNFALSGVHTIGGRWVHEPRFAWTRVDNSVFQQNQGVSVNNAVGLPELSSNPRDWGLSLITLTGFSPLGHEYNNPQEGLTNFVQLTDAVTWMRGRHMLKMGAEWRHVAQEAYRDVQARGLMQFSQFGFTGNALGDLLLGLPAVSTGALLDNPQNLRAPSYALFLQDTFQVSPAFTLSAGLRYEVNTPPVDANDRVSVYDPETGTIVPVGQGSMPRGGYTTDRNNLAPRVGFAWAAGERSVLRGGYGIAYDQAALAPNEFLYFNQPYFDLSLYFTVPGLYTLTLSDPWPDDFPLPLPKSATAVQRDLATGYLHQWNLTFERRLTDRRTLSATYAGSLGRNLVAARDINQPAPSAESPNLRPNPLFADILMIESRARSRFQAIEIAVDQALSRGVSFQAAYTVGKSMDDASSFFTSAGDANFPMDSNDPQAEWARSDFDVRHRFTFAGSWALPFGVDRRWLTSGAGAAILGNWDLHAVFAGQSGRPFSVYLDPNVDRSNTGRANLGFGANDRPNVNDTAASANPTPEQWFNTAAYSMPEFGTFGNAGRNTLDGPGFKNLNLAFAKRIPMERGALQVRVELFNVFNWTNFDLPDSFFLSPTFGQILSAGTPRRMQLGVKYVF
jgi:hypothetical protein